MRLAIIGYGTTANFSCESCERMPRLSSCRFSRYLTQLTKVYLALEDMLSLQPDIVVERAGRGALRNAAKWFRGRVSDLMVASVGALADRELEAKLREATSHGRRIVIPGGALGGIDALSAAREAGLSSVHYAGRKPPIAWKRTAAEALINLDSVSTRTTFLECGARTAALTPPKRQCRCGNRPGGNRL